MLEFRVQDTLPFPSLAATQVIETRYATAGIQFTFSSTTTDADPGNGNLRLNNASPASATQAFIDNLDRLGSNVTAWLALLAGSGAGTNRGILHIEDRDDPTQYAEYRVTGAVTAASGYYKVPLAYLGGSLAPVNGIVLVAGFFRSGSDGSADPSTFAEKSDIATFDPASAPVYLRTLGLDDAEDGGGSLWLYRGSEPVATPAIWKTQDFDGNWYEAIVRNEIDLERSGLKADGATDATDALTETSTWLGTKGGGRLRLPIGKTVCDDAPEFTASGVLLEGYAPGSSNAAGDFGSILSLENPDTGPKCIIGSEETTNAEADRTYSIGMKNMRVMGSGGPGPLFLVRFHRDARFSDLTAVNANGGFADFGAEDMKCTFVWMRDVEGNFEGAGLEDKGALHFPYMSGGFVGQGLEMESDAGSTTSAGMDIPADAFGIPDGFRISNSIFGRFGTGMRIGSGISNFHGVAVQLDRCQRYGLDISLAADFSVLDFSLASSHLVAEGVDAEQVGIRLDRGAKEINILRIIDTHIKKFRLAGMEVEAANEWDVSHCQFIDCGTLVDNGQDVITINTAQRYQLAHNTVRNQNATNNSRYCLNLATTGTSHQRRVVDNIFADYQTLPIFLDDANRGSLVTDIRRGNTGEGMLGKYRLGPFFSDGITGSVSGQQMLIGGVEAPNRLRRGRITGIEVVSGSARTAGNVTFAPYINGSTQSSLLSAQLNSGDTTKKEATRDSGIAFVAGDLVDVRYTSSGWTPTAAKVSVWLECVDD